MFSRMSGLIGTKGLYLSACKTFKVNPMPVKVPIFGLVRTYHEIRNIHDNFGIGELRDRTMEEYLSKKEAPCVIDCGVNVGITVRWWFHLNRHSKIFGVDMIEETQDFTVEALKSLGITEDQYKPIVAALWSVNGKSTDIGVNDPLLGDNGFYRPITAENKRHVVTKTLDSIFDKEDIREVDLIKMDLEAAGVEAFEGAPRLLNKTKNIVFEVHNEEECKRVSKLLSASGFVLRRANGRHLWLERSA